MAEPKILQLVDWNGSFMAADLDLFAKEQKFGDLRQDYQIIAIMGPHSSGKSTLLNHLVSVRLSRRFNVMDSVHEEPALRK